MYFKLLEFKNEYNNNIKILFTIQNSRNGFNHIAYNEGGEEISRRHYINRTWEAYPFQALIKDIIQKYNYKANFDINEGY